MRHGARPQLGLQSGLQDGPPLRLLKRFAALALLTAIGAGPAAAQIVGEPRIGASGDFDLYVLALTWSPGFCELEGERKGRQQCAPGQGIGFTVHGLWPQHERGRPTDCGPAAGTLPRAALDQARGLFPDEGLARHEWRTHGACSGKGPTEYFGDVRRARERVRIPEALQSVTERAFMAPLDIERAFAAANPGLRPDMMSVVCRRGVLQEVRICLASDLRGFRHCPDVDRSGCRGGEIRINPPR